MAEGTRQRQAQGNGAKAEESEERAATKRVVLKRERVLVLPEDPEAAGKAVQAVKNELGTRASKHIEPLEAWAVVGVFEGHSKQHAIEAHAGKAGTPTAKPGVYKAPSETAWKGGRVYVKPPEPKVEASDLD